MKILDVKLLAHLHICVPAQMNGPKGVHSEAHELGLQNLNFDERWFSIFFLGMFSVKNVEQFDFDKKELYMYILIILLLIHSRTVRWLYDQYKYLYLG